MRYTESLNYRGFGWYISSRGTDHSRFVVMSGFLCLFLLAFYSLLKICVVLRIIKLSRSLLRLSLRFRPYFMDAS